MKHPYAAPARLSPDLARVKSYWKGLLRGAATMPFSDDLRLTDLPGLAERLFVIDVFEKPERFRFAVVGAGLAQAPLAGRFLDEVALVPPLDYLRSQCSAAVEAAAPTFHRNALGCSRLVLPMWGEGHVNLLLGVVEPA